MSEVVFLHAFPCDHRMWLPQRAAVAARGWSATAVDLPGFGKQSLPTAAPSLDVVADLILGQLPHDSAPVFVGVSLGGYIALNLARRHADRVGGLILCDTKATADGDEARANRERLALAVEEQPGACGRILEQAVLPGLLGHTTREHRPATVATVREWLHEADPASVAWYQRAMAVRPDSRAALADYAGPTAVIWGDEDALSPWHEQELMLAALPGARLSTISGAGHLANVEDPEPVTTAILEFLEGARA